MTFRKWFLIAFFALLTACSAKRPDNELYVGTLTGPETDIMQTAQKVAQEKYGLHIKIIEFEDYVTPNVALVEKSIDANMFQHQPYLDSMVNERHFKIVSLGKTFIYPMGLYSKKFTQLKDIPNHAMVGIPIDPSNSARALLLLERAGLIKLNTQHITQISLANIIENPKHLHIQEMEAAQLPRALNDMALAAINANYAYPAHFTLQNALFSEDKYSPYANIVAVRQGEAQDKRFLQLMDALHDPAVVQKAETLFSGGAVPAW
jgi:D-methionine transport system substrate-binding protein